MIRDKALEEAQKWQERKVEEERERKWKEEEDQVAREKALDESRKQQLKVSCYFSFLYSWELIISRY